MKGLPTYLLFDFGVGESHSSICDATTDAQRFAVGIIKNPD
jgi:hypothetical protein